MTDYQKLRRLAEAATPGPWRTYRESDFDGIMIESDSKCICAFDTWEHRPDEREPDAAFIAAANPTTVLALLDDNEALRKQLDIATELLDSRNKQLAAAQAEVDVLRAAVKHGAEQYRAMTAARDRAVRIARDWMRCVVLDNATDAHDHDEDSARLDELLKVGKS